MNFASTKVSALARFPYGILTRAAREPATKNLQKNVPARSWTPPRSHLPYTNFNLGRKTVLLLKPSKTAFVYIERMLAAAPVRPRGISSEVLDATQISSTIYYFQFWTQKVLLLKSSKPPSYIQNAYPDPARTRPDLTYHILISILGAKKFCC